jgi:hypothetical protein
MRILGYIAVVAAALAAVIFFFNGMDMQIKRLKFENERAAIKRSFTTKVPHLIAADEEHATFDLTQTVKNYAKDIARLYQKYPEFKEPDAILKRYEKEYQEGKKDESKMRAVRERIAFVKDVWEKLLTENYKPEVTAHGASIRADLYNIEKKAVDGQDKLIVSALFLGPTTDKTTTYGAIEMNVALADDESTAKKRAAKQLKDLKAERKAVITGGGEPNTLVTEPDKWVEDFPPGIVVGFYDFPLFPAESRQMTLTMNFEVKNAGGGRVLNELKFKPLDMQSHWKLPEGSSFEADEQTAE